MKYLTVYRLAIWHSLKNYKPLVGLCIFLVTCLLIFAHLWKLAAAKVGVIYLDPEKLLWYIAFNEWVLISIPDVHEEIEQDLRSGKLAYLLPRPISYLFLTFFEALGILTVNLFVLASVAFSFTWIYTGMLPFDFVPFLISLALGFFAGSVAIIFQMLIGISAFWIQEVSPFQWVWERLLFALGGLILPLSVYPEWMQTFARFTPFPVILGERSVLTLDFSLSQVLSCVSLLLFWGVLGFSFLLLLYRKGLQILNIAGG